MNSRVTIIKDDVSKVFAAIRELVGTQALIGVPEDTTQRDPGDGEDAGITNAALGYIHEFGSPEHNIPARPFLIPGVEKARADVLVPLRAVADAAMKGDKSRVEVLLEAAGAIGRDAAKLEINTGNFAPLQPETIRRRNASRDTSAMRKAEKEYLKLIAGGASPAEAQEAAGIRALINTGQLRNALTYVVRKV